MSQEQLINKILITGQGLFFAYFFTLVLILVTTWKLFEKAGQPGWASILPIFNLLVFIRIAQKSWYWILLLLIPGVNIVVLILLFHAISLRFGHGVWFTVGLVLLGLIFFPILAFGRNQYKITNHEVRIEDF